MFLPILMFLACSKPVKTFDQIDLQGHRGARGLWPENSLYGFQKVLDLGVNTLELDLAITGDSQVLVSHEPYFSPEICLYKSGNEISEEEARKLNIYKMSYEEIQAYDCGTKLHPRFPDQEKVAVTKPLLSEVLSTIESEVAERGLDTMRYNIELKSSASTDNEYHPTPDVFSDMVYSVIDQHLDWSQVTIQSFDFRVLQYFKKQYPTVNLALLIENELPWEVNLDSLGFDPDIYSCDYMLLSKKIVRSIQERDIDVIPWTVNERQDMDQLLKWGVDGIITDYPDRTK